MRDVSREAFLDSANSEVAVAGKAGLITAVRRGEAPILARFEGNYASTTVTVMGDRAGFVWTEPPAYGKIDELVAAKWKRMKILPSGLCSDADFLRRVYIDLTGLPPTADDVRKFLADTRDSRVKRDELVDRLIGNPEFVDYWTNKWADLLQVNRKFLGVEGSVAFRNWIRGQVAANTALRQVRPRDHHGQRIEPRESRRRHISRSSATRRRPWRTRRSSSWRCGSIATSATTIRSSAGPRTSITRRPPISRRSA